MAQVELHSLMRLSVPQETGEDADDLASNLTVAS